MTTPNSMPVKRSVKSIRETMAVRHARCADGPNCTGPGCRYSRAPREAVQVPAVQVLPMLNSGN